MKILIINPPDENKCIENPDDEGRAFLEADDFGAFPPLGALYVLSYLKKHTSGHQFHFLDCIGEKVSHVQLESIIKDIRPDVVGVTSFTISLVDCCMVARTVRKFVPNAHICLGGHHPIAYPLEAAKLPDFDSIVVGEGEYAFTDLVNALDKGHEYTQIRGVYTAGSIEKFVGSMGRDRRFLARVTVPPAYVDDIDAIPLPSREYIRHIPYRSIIGASGNLATLISSRGCPYLCTFCDVPYKTYRQRSHDLVLDEIQSCLDLGYREFHFYDDLFNIKPQKIIDFCEAIEQRGMNFIWDFRGRANTVNWESLARAKKNGLRMISFGIETGTDEGLRILKKGAKTAKFREVFDWCRKLGILTVADYIIGLSWERSPHDVKRSIDFLVDLEPDYANISILKLYPNTEIYDQAVEKGVIKPGRWQEFALNPKPDFIVDHWDEHMDLSTLVKLQKNAYRRFYFRPRYIMRSAINTRSLYELVSKVSGAFRLMRTNERTV